MSSQFTYDTITERLTMFLNCIPDIAHMLTSYGIFNSQKKSLLSNLQQLFYLRSYFANTKSIA